MHVLRHLALVVDVGRSKFEVDNDGFLAIHHHSVWATINNLARGWVDV
jgi:hypothetical protein